MLDQNTDRMWYVIGAIVIGAAIIAMGLNIFSESFDTVDNLMVSQLERLDSDVSYIGGNLLEYSDMQFQGVTVSGDSSLISVNIRDQNPVGDNNGVFFQKDDLDLKPDTNYVFRYKYRLNSGHLRSFGGHFGLNKATENKVYVNGVLNSDRYHSWDSVYVSGISDKLNELNTVEVYFKTHPIESEIYDNSLLNSISHSIWIQPNRSSTLDYDVTLKNIGLFEVSN